MAMMMAGRVLLVCALCVLWCVAGGICDEEAGGPAGGVVGNGGRSAVESSESSAPGPDASEPPNDVLNVNQATGTSAVKSLEGKEVSTAQRDVLSRGKDKKDGSPSEHLEDPAEDAPENEKTKLKLKKEEQEGIVPLQSQANVSPQPQPQPQQSQPPSSPQPHISSSEKGKGVGENTKGGAGQSSLAVENKGNNDPKAPRKEDSLNVPGKESESSEQAQTKVPNTVPPEHKIKNEMLTPEQKTNEGQNTDTSTNLPETQKESKEYPASREGAVQSTLTGGQEQEAEPSTSEEPSPFGEEQQSTGTKTTADARTPDAAAKDKNALRTNATANTGDSDGSTAVSHATSPLLLLLVACAAAAAVVAV
ncbi:Mucin-associated surface protein (MASP) [Trypanosoma cruzi]|uniref:Mucin-associated surface protein (MASP), putative n=2 Tax=Trypanosoma cruzi TaxID=5693 RepID=Q4D6A4_TRYCC|nr:mucin-associated surface protein (MASP), putative [Trypanosoma cruzi]EAN88056.1 mucin-associated surface protein (MASP), putative [Trypanosoma cruzi]PWV14389.1 Mucin-associated surface protein (MASP) [Trypanosoma cruzi]RNC40373.1 mucin-associated surface protein (MASP) [Trypanosoma cruzi]|eukprot:XP_809907.1 mucin-associated surface protein (MASP) [Trypanosoma cruzi strain CL Brener]